MSVGPCRLQTLPGPPPTMRSRRTGGTAPASTGIPCWFAFPPTDERYSSGSLSVAYVAYLRLDVDSASTSPLARRSDELSQSAASDDERRSRYRTGSPDRRRRRARVPRPRAGSPRGGRVMGAREAGRSRRRLGIPVRRNRSSSDRPGTPRVDRAVSRRRRVPRLSHRIMSRAVGCGECTRGVTSFS